MDEMDWMEGVNEMDWMERDGQQDWMERLIFSFLQIRLFFTAHLSRSLSFCCRPKYGSLKGPTGTIGTLTFFALFAFFLSLPSNLDFVNIFHTYFGISFLFFFFSPAAILPRNSINVRNRYQLNP